MPYTVVFAYTPKSLSCGNRFIIHYTDQNEFKKFNTPLKLELSVLAQGISHEEAQNQISLTPEACRLTHAVGEICYAADGHIDLGLVPLHLFNAFFAIEGDRVRQEVHDLHPEPSFPFIKIGEEDTEKNRLLHFIQEKLTNPNGTIGDLNTVRSMLIQEIARLIDLRPTA
jgi:hypothetical protein